MNNLIYLLKLGAHLGSSISEYNYSSSLNQFLLGSRYNYYIFNLKYSLYLLKRSISFLTNLGFHNSHLFFKLIFSYYFNSLYVFLIFYIGITYILAIVLLTNNP